MLYHIENSNIEGKPHLTLSCLQSQLFFVGLCMCVWGGGGGGRLQWGQALSINNKGNLSSKILFNSYIVFSITLI